jgi:hypothetical protein
MASKPALAAALTLCLLSLPTLAQPVPEPTAATTIPTPPPCAPPKPTPAQIEAFGHWQARLHASQGLHRWAVYVTAAGLGGITGALLAGVIGRGSVTITSSSPILYVPLGAVGVAASLDVASYFVNPGIYYPPPATSVRASDRGDHIFRVAWRF